MKFFTIATTIMVLALTMTAPSYAASPIFNKDLFTGWESKNTGSDGYQYVFGLYLYGIETGKCIGPDFGRNERNSCIGLGGYTVEAYDSNGFENESGYCCPQFDVSKLEDGGCKKMDESDGEGCLKVVDDPEEGGLVVVVETNDATFTQYCCSSGLVAKKTSTMAAASDEDTNDNRRKLLFNQTDFFTGWESFNTGSDGFKYVFDRYLHGAATRKCIGNEFGLRESDACLGLGGYIIEAFHAFLGKSGDEYDPTGDSGFCCPQFDVSKLEDGGCEKIDSGSCPDVVSNSNGLSILTDDDGESFTLYCCPSGIKTTPSD